LQQTQVTNEDVSLAKLRVKIYADGADKAAILRLTDNPFVKGFTTNPTLMHKAGITEYEAFARELLVDLGDYPISFEVFADEHDEMRRQARKIAEWGSNVYVKIPITNTRMESCLRVVRDLTQDGIKVNVTALMTISQVDATCQALVGGAAACVSVFAGRIADTGRDPMPMMAESVAHINDLPAVELIWASPRELLNIFHADSIGTHIITVTPDILSKLGTVGKDLDEFSLDTVKMFANDASAAGFRL